MFVHLRALFLFSISVFSGFNASPLVFSPCGPAMCKATGLKYGGTYKAEYVLNELKCVLTKSRDKPKNANDEIQPPGQLDSSKEPNENQENSCPVMFETLRNRKGTLKCVPLEQEEVENERSNVMTLTSASPCRYRNEGHLVIGVILKLTGYLAYEEEAMSWRSTQVRWQTSLLLVTDPIRQQIFALLSTHRLVCQYRDSEIDIIDETFIADMAVDEYDGNVLMVGGARTLAWIKMEATGRCGFNEVKTIGSAYKISGLKGNENCVVTLVNEQNGTVKAYIGFRNYRWIQIVRIANDVSELLNTVTLKETVSDLYFFIPQDLLVVCHNTGPPITTYPSKKFPDMNEIFLDCKSVEPYQNDSLATLNGIREVQIVDLQGRTKYTLPPPEVPDTEINLVVLCSNVL